MKKIRFKIGNKIFAGFLALILIFTLNAVSSIFTLSRSSDIIEETAEIIDPSMAAINDFTLLVTRSKMLITNWVYLQMNEEDKEALKELHSREYPQLKEELNLLAAKWNDEAEKKKLDTIFRDFEALLALEKGIMNSLVTFEDYEDPLKRFDANMAIEGEVLDRSAKLDKKLEELSAIKEKETEAAKQNLTASFDTLQKTTITLGIISIAIGLMCAFYMARSITTPINYIKDIIIKLGKGELPEESAKSFSSDEIGEMKVAVDKLVTGLKSTSGFAENIGKGHYTAEFVPLSESDVLGNALIDMRNNLQKVAEEDKIRNWTTEGLARFGETLRKNNDNITRLADEIIANLVKYLGANQGGLFIIHEERDGIKYLNLAACYAWNKKKYLEQKIHEGEGLTGQAWLEKDTVFLTEVPDNYVNITSGLGEANPSSIVIIPLKVNEEVFGVVELASFHIFKEYEIDFVEKIAESIASTISSVKINERTQELLQESTQMTEQLRSQEEEMRQNMEELQATQEEMQRAQKDRDQKENLINLTNMQIELDANFRIGNLNHVFTQILQYDLKDLIGKPLETILVSKDSMTVARKNLEEGMVWSGVLELTNKYNENVLVKVSAGKIEAMHQEEHKYLLFATEISNIEVA